ncbi:MAG: cupin domain-containing protein [Candidatus Limnocylindria bacterium]
MRIARSSEAPLEPMATDTFSGTVRRRDLGRIDVPAGAAVAVTFELGARTGWHSHSGGQVLFVIEGEGRVGTREGEVAEVGVGDLVEAPPDEEHWHGASVGARLTHVALSFGETVWLEPVKDD